MPVANAPDFNFVINDGVPAMPSEEQSPLVQGIIGGMNGSNGKPGRPAKFKDCLDEEEVEKLFGESESLTPGALISKIREMFDCSHVTAYKFINNSVDDGLITKVGKTFVATVLFINKTADTTQSNTKN